MDASIATKWFLNDEQHVELAEEILIAYREGRLDLYAPDHIRYEVGNALWNAARRGRINEEQGRRSLTAFLSWQIATIGNDALIRVAYDFASRFDCALYDGLYIALADNTDTTLLHADERLRNSLNGRFAHELWIEDFTAPADS